MGGKCKRLYPKQYEPSMEAAVRYVVVELGIVVLAGWILFLRSVLVWQHIHPRA